MEKNPRLASINRFRKRAVEWANDSERGERFARWLGKATGGLQLRLLFRPGTAIPWTPLKKPLAQATVAIVTTGGVHLCSDQPFKLKSDATFRVIPRSAMAQNLCITHDHYDRRDAGRDLNLVFPLERLLELEKEGVIGRVANENYGFGFVKNPMELLAPGRKVGKMLKQADVDLVILVPA
ncbi:MAG TPA: glycine/sarcosine/betaine reductase selenoprotein B family protein [Ktedonosporobacter sp.]|nr:glycine/sarcosine/betaine reductase selenoprotein B family protein [Ktedonosporobacter sp.]